MGSIPIFATHSLTYTLDTRCLSNQNIKQTHLAGVIQELVLKLLDPQNLLKHLVELVLAEDELRGSAGRHSLLVLPGVFLAAVDGVELGDPRTQHSLFAEAVDLGQTAHTLLYVLLENLP